MLGYLLFLFTFGIGNNTDWFSGGREKIFILLSFKKYNGEQCHDSGCKKSPFKVVRITGITQITTNQRGGKGTDIHSHIENGICSIQPSVSRFVELPHERRNGRFETTISQDQESESAIHHPVSKFRIIQSRGTHEHQELSDCHHHCSPKHRATDSPIFISNVSANQRS